MKIQQVEELVGISKKNIRFYEEQGLLRPGRAENGYREYGQADVLRLKEIKLLRKLAVPIEDIRAVLQGESALDTCLDRQLREFDRQRESLSAMEGMTRELLSRPGLTLEGLDAEGCLDKIERLEKPIDDKKVRFSFDARRRSGDDVLIIKGLGKAKAGVEPDIVDS